MSTVHRWARDRTLYAVLRETSERRRSRGFPGWQFVNGRVLPGLHIVLDQAHGLDGHSNHHSDRHSASDGYASMHPLSLEALMTTPQEELDGRTPIAWLASGGDPHLVASLVESAAYS